MRSSEWQLERERAAQRDGEQLLTMSFVKKYIHFAKNRLKPVLTDDANEFISAAYAEMRQSAAGSKTLPVTPLALETIIRLSSAHAKSRLSRVVEEVGEGTAASSRRRGRGSPWSSPISTRSRPPSNLL